MGIIEIGLIVSFSCLVFLVLLFRHEETVGTRFGERMRAHADFFVLQTTHTLRRGIRFLGRDFLRQIFHYLFHTFLQIMLEIIRKSEHGLRNIIYVNKTLAKDAERESEIRSKLEEVALHKVESALTEDEKKAHRDKMLNGM